MKTQERFSGAKARSRPIDRSATLTIEASMTTRNCVIASTSSATSLFLAVDCTSTAGVVTELMRLAHRDEDEGDEQTGDDVVRPADEPAEERAGMFGLIAMLTVLANR